MKTKLLLLAAAALTCVALLPAAQAATVTTCPPGVTNHAYCETSELPTATASFSKNQVKIINAHGTFVLDTGMHVSCLPNLPESCGSSMLATGNVGNAARVIVLGRAGWHVRSGKTSVLKLKLKLNSKRAKRALKTLKKIRLTIKVTTHGGVNGRPKTTTRHVTVRLPH